MLYLFPQKYNCSEKSDKKACCHEKKVTPPGYWSLFVFVL